MSTDPTTKESGISRQWYDLDMKKGLVPVEEWRQLSDDEQRAIIRAGRTEIEDLPSEMRMLVEEMVADARRPTADGADSALRQQSPELP